MPVVVIPAGVAVSVLLAVFTVGLAYIWVALILFGLAGAVTLFLTLLLNYTRKLDVRMASKSAGTSEFKPQDIKFFISDKVKHFAQTLGMREKSDREDGKEWREVYNNRFRKSITEKSEPIGPHLNFSRNYYFDEKFREYPCIGFFVNNEKQIIIYRGPLYYYDACERWMIDPHEPHVYLYKGTLFERKAVVITRNPKEAIEIITGALTVIHQNAIEGVGAKKAKIDAAKYAAQFESNRAASAQAKLNSRFQ